jgi:hypothetical protein
MNKKSYWFKHDLNARSDPKLKKLHKKHGTSGIGIYWMLIEMIFEQNGYIEYDTQYLADEVRDDENIIISVINEFGLFSIEQNMITSLSALRRLNEMKKRSEQGKKAANERWNN